MTPKPPPQPRRLRDGFIDALGGLNTNVDPFLLPSNMIAGGQNAVLRGGFPGNRPGFQRVVLDFHDSGSSEWWATKAWQGAWVYRPATGDNFHLAAVGGRLFKVDPANGYLVTEITPTQQTSTTADAISPGMNLTVTLTVTDGSSILIGLPLILGDGRYQVSAKVNNLLTLTNLSATPGVSIPSGTPVIYLDPNPSTLPVTWYEQAEEFMIIQDGQSSAIIFDGGTTRRAAPDEVLVGTVMKYHGNRLWVAVNGDLVIAGDIALIGNTANLLKFTEYLNIQGGGAFRVNGTITAMVQMPALDASLGQGPLQIITTDSFVSLNLPPQRDLWGTLTNGVQTISLLNAGALGQYCTVVINGDPWFRSPDGIRSFVVARRNFGDPSNTPMSAEITGILDDEAPELLNFCSAVLFDQRLLMTATPHRLTFGAYFSKIISLDFNPLSSMSRKNPPIYDTPWTGLHVYQLLTGNFTGQDRCYAYTNEPEGIGLWEITKDAPFDGDGGRIPVAVEYPSLKFQSPMDLKKLASCKVFVDQVRGEVDFNLFFRPDDAQCWVAWNQSPIKLCATARKCASGCAPMKTYQAGYQPHIDFGQPHNTCSEFAEQDSRFAYSWNLRLEWTGHSRIKRLFALADMFGEQPLGKGPDSA